MNAPVSFCFESVLAACSARLLLVDRAGNRTKRIFVDPVGRQAGAHTDPYRLQTYRRDTGELMFDLSVPIFMDGRHWGGFRVGYRIE